ncbi:MAG: flagellar FlbD family protein [Bacillota bacterium]|nr:flagellar FlbD family protein [Bacillota bacterium]
MIYVTRLNGTEFAINPDLIEIMEETPDTVITLTGGNKYVVSESVEILIERIAEFRRRCRQICQLEEQSDL